MDESKINKLLKIINCRLCGHPMVNVGTTENGEFCMECVRKDVSSNENSVFGDPGAVVLNSFLSRVCQHVHRLNYVINRNGKALNNVSKLKDCLEKNGSKINSVRGLRSELLKMLTSSEGKTLLEEIKSNLFNCKRTFEEQTEILNNAPCRQTLMRDSVESQELESAEEKVPQSSFNDASNLVDNDESDNDSFVPATPEAKEPTTRISCIMATGLSTENRRKLVTFSKYFNLNISQPLTSKADCLVIENDQRTLKALYARCRRLPLVHHSWVEHSLTKGVLLPIGSYQITEEPKTIPALFRELDVILLCPIQNSSEADIKEILRVSGSRVHTLSDWQPGPPALKRILIASNDSLEYNVSVLQGMMKKFKAPVVDFSYLICLWDTGRLKNIRSHLICSCTDEELLAFGFPQSIIELNSDDEV